MDRIPEIGEKVKVFVSDTIDSFVDAKVIRVYDEETYRQEIYPNGLNPHYEDHFNETLVDVEFPLGYVSKAHFLSGLKEYRG